MPTSTYQTEFESPVPEQITLRITGLIQDELGVAIPGANLTTLTLTLYNSTTEAVLNLRNASDILGVNGGSVDASGNFTLTLTPADNALLGTGRSEKHIALIVWTYNSGNSTGRFEVIFTVVNVTKGP